MTIRPICRTRPKIDDRPPRPAEHSAAEQHAQQTGTKEAGGKTAQHAHAGPIEEAAGVAGALGPGRPGWVMVRSSGWAAPGAVGVVGGAEKHP